MLKKNLKTNGAQKLSKNELQSINGGGGSSNVIICNVGFTAVKCNSVTQCCTSYGCGVAGGPDCL